MNYPGANSGTPASESSLPPEAIAFATRMFNAARQGDSELLQQAILAGLPANLSNEKGDTLVCVSLSCAYTPDPSNLQSKLSDLLYACSFMIAHARGIPWPFPARKIPH